MGNGPSLAHKKSKRKKKKVKGHHQGPSSMSLCPPSTSQQQQPSTHTEIIEQGEDVLEVVNIGKYTHAECCRNCCHLSKITICVFQRWAPHTMWVVVRQALASRSKKIRPKCRPSTTLSSVFRSHPAQRSCPLSPMKVHWLLACYIDYMLHI